MQSAIVNCPQIWIFALSKLRTLPQLILWPKLVRQIIKGQKEDISTRSKDIYKAISIVNIKIILGIFHHLELVYGFESHLLIFNKVVKYKTHMISIDHVMPVYICISFTLSLLSHRAHEVNIMLTSLPHEHHHKQVLVGYDINLLPS